MSALCLYVSPCLCLFISSLHSSFTLSVSVSTCLCACLCVSACAYLPVCVCVCVSACSLYQTQRFHAFSSMHPSYARRCGARSLAERKKFLQCSPLVQHIHVIMRSTRVSCCLEG